MTAQEIERLAVVETKVDNIERSIDELKTLVKEAMDCKADKTALTDLSTSVATIRDRVYIGVGIGIALSVGVPILLTLFFH